MPPPSKPMLAKRGTTIFTVMSALAQEVGAVNLGQGFPDFECDPDLVDAVHKAMLAGANQYPPMPGIPALRQGISDKIAVMYGHRYDPNTEITVTAGATQAILTTLLALVHPGDEVIVIEPAYDSYVPNIELAGGIPVLVAMRPDYTVDWARVGQAVTPKTRLIIVNSPHNPTGRTLTAEDLTALRDIAVAANLIVLSDEVYEHMVFDGQAHRSVASDPALATRSVIVSSFGKTYHVTGWKVGYVAAPAALMVDFRKVHQFNVFTVNTPMQVGLAEYLKREAPYRNLPAFYQAKRDHFRAGLAKTPFRLLPCEGTYFQVVGYENLRGPERDLSEAEFAQWLTREIGVAAIPISAFYQQPVENKTVRFCFAKKNETLDLALAKLAKLGG